VKAKSKPVARAKELPPAPPGLTEFGALGAGLKAALAEQGAKLDAVLAEQHELRRLVHRMTVPVDVVLIDEAAKRIGTSRRTLERLTARGVFSDGRAPERRGAGSDRVYFADELEVYKHEGAKGVARLREELGRN
jgi:hypothetical protein